MPVIAWVKDRSAKSVTVLVAPLCCIVPKEVRNSSVCSWVGNTGGDSISIIRVSTTSLIDSELDLLS